MDEERPKSEANDPEPGTNDPEPGTNDPDALADSAEATDDRETTYDLLQRGHALMEGRHFAQAAIVLERADRQEPAKGSILEALGRAYFNSGQAERARATFEALLEIDPSSHYGHYAIGQSLKRLGQTDRARTHLRLAVALSPDSKLYAGALARLGPADANGDAGAADEPERTD
jgi:tetratricopeptide (TPR) repeat protein